MNWMKLAAIAAIICNTGGSVGLMYLQYSLCHIHKIQNSVFAGNSSFGLYFFKRTFKTQD